MSRLSLVNRMVTCARGHVYKSGPWGETYSARAGECPECGRVWRRRAQAKYRVTDKGKNTNEKYVKSDKGKATIRLRGKMRVASNKNAERMAIRNANLTAEKRDAYNAKRRARSARPEYRLARRLGISVKVAREMMQ